MSNKEIEKKKEEEVPECIYFEHGIPICATFEYGIGEWMSRDEYEFIINDTSILEEVVTCIKCGATDISYPM